MEDEFNVKIKLPLTLIFHSRYSCDKHEITHKRLCVTGN